MAELLSEKFCENFYLSVYWATQVSKCIGVDFPFKKMRGLGNEHLENLRLES